MLQFLQRLLAAVPDAITAAAFLTAWVAPARLGPEYVRNLTLAMAIEFIVIHSSVFYAVIAGVNAERRKRVAWLLGLSCLYLVFVFGFSIEYRSSWPVFAFGWLLVSRFMHLWTSPASSDAEGARMVRLWAVSVVAYLFGAFVAILAPLPRLGMTSDFVSSMESAGASFSSGETYTTLAFGLLYFSILAAAKFALGGPDAARRVRGNGRAAAAGSVRGVRREQGES